MKRAIIFIFTLLSVLFFLCSCGKGHKATTQIIDGVKHVYNPSSPQKGQLSLQLEKIFKIDSSNVKSDKDIFFNMATKADDGNIFIGNIGNMEIYTFNKDGNMVNRFLKQGEGPGENPYGVFSISVSRMNIRFIKRI